MASEHAPVWGRRHHQEVARRARGEVDLHKRQTYANARFTFYDVGLGACGQTNVASDFIVALNVEQYGSGYPGPYCFQSITISYGGKTAQATIMDECMGCPWGGLDFSRGLFDYFASESDGVLYGTWWFNDGSGGGETTTSSTPVWTPTTTSTPEWTPTSTYIPITTYQPTTTSTTPTPTTTSTTPSQSTSTSTAPPTTSTSSTATTSSSASLSANTVASGLAVPTSGVTSESTSILQDLSDVLVNFGVFLSACKDAD
ncbi:hypothetical protein ID866_3942 [Astraeus odoratus]|nr:hypothetical protein ID866_3942 [Astraeus odoratus]